MKADLVVVADGAEGEQAGDFRGELALGELDAAEISRGAHVDDEHHRQLAFLGEFFDEGGSRAARSRSSRSRESRRRADIRAPLRSSFRVP